MLVSKMNYTAFSEAGIPPEDIDPRNNVLTFNAWKAKGRRVAKGAKSVAVTVWIPIIGKKSDPEPNDTGDDDAKKKRGGMRPKLTRLFHEWQTVEAEAAKGSRPKAWDNPALVRYYYRKRAIGAKPKLFRRMVNVVRTDLVLCPAQFQTPRVLAFRLIRGRAVVGRRTCELGKPGAN